MSSRVAANERAPMPWRPRVAYPNLADSGVHRCARSWSRGGSRSPSQTFDIAGMRASAPHPPGSRSARRAASRPASATGCRQTLDKDTLEGTRQTIERRINGLGVSEPLGPDARQRSDHRRAARHRRSPGRHRGPAKNRAARDHRSPRGSTFPPGTLVNTTLGPARGHATKRTPPPTRTRRQNCGPRRRRAPPPRAAGRRRTPHGPLYETIIRGADLKRAYFSTGKVAMNT